MTIASTTSRITYVGNGSTTAFPVPFYFQSNADLVISTQDLSGTVTTKLLGTDYNLTGATLSAGGACTFTIAPTTGFIIAITRVPQITQTTSYNNNDPFPAKSHELALDKATTVDQYLKSLIDRAIIVAPTDTPPMTTLPPASVRALKALTFDGSGNPSVSTPVTGTAVSSAMIPVVAASTLALGRQAFGIPPVYNVKLYGAIGNGTTDDSSAFASAIAAAVAVGGGYVDVPAGFYLVSSGVTLSGNVILRGAGRVSSWLYRRSDGPVLTVGSSGQNGAEQLAVMGYGASPLDAIYGETTFAAALTADALVMSSSGGFIRDIQVQGGRHALYIDSLDAVITNVDCSFSYGSSNVYTTGANWHYRCKWDTGGDVAATANPPYPAWAAATAYTLGKIVSRSGFLIICSTAGTSAGSAPALRNYGFTISDGTAAWRLLAPATYYGLYITGTGENHFHQVDLSGSGGYAASLVNDQTPTGSAATIFESGVISDVVDIVNGDWVCITNSEFGSSIVLTAGHSGYTTICNNWTVTAAAFNIVVGANVGKFIINNNQMRAGSITVAAGTSDRYQIAHNNHVTVTDGGTGLNKSVSGNS